MEYVLFFVITFILVYLLYNLFVIRKEKALKKMKSSKDVLLLCKLGEINIDSVNLKALVNKLSLFNSLLISLMGTIILIINNYITNFYLWIIISSILSILLLIPSIIFGYKFIGKIIKKEGKKNV